MFVCSPWDWDILYNELVNSFYIVCGYLTFVTKKSWRSPKLKVTSKKTNMKIFQIDYDDLASEEPSFMKAVDWRSIYTGQMIYFVYRQIIYCTGKASTSKQIKTYLQVFFPIALKCYGVARTEVKIIYIWDLAQMILFFYQKLG